jgi:hypothetical protein
VKEILANKFKALLNLKLRCAGYTAEQRTAIIDDIGDNTIIAWIKKYGPYPLGLVGKLFPIIWDRELPEGTPEPSLEPRFVDTFNELGRLHKPFDETEAELALEPGDIDPRDDKKKKTVFSVDPPPRPRR